MVYLNAILFFSIFSHFILKTESDLLKGILLGSALKDDDSQETEILVIRIPRQRSIKKSKKTTKTRLTTTTTTSTTTTTEMPTTTTALTYKYYDIPLDSITSVKSTQLPLMLSTEYSTTQTSVTTTENICGANQTYTHCLNECGNRCTDYLSNQLCPHHCFGFGCTCAHNFVRDVRTDRCVKSSDCPKPKKCSTGEKFFICGGCGPTCETPVPVCSRICRSEGGCDCIRGLVRNIHGKCVPLGLCPLSDSNMNLKTKQKVITKTNSTKTGQNSLAKRHLKQLFDNIDENHYIFD